MRNFKLKISVLGAVLGLFTACSNEPSLEKYIVEKQRNPDFMYMDVPAGLFTKEENMSGMPDKVQDAFRSVKKANVIALPANGNEEKMSSETAQLDEIFHQEKYKPLMNLNVKGNRVHLIYVGEKDRMDSMIIYGKSAKKGFGVVRLLGKNMNAKALSTIVLAYKNGEINFNAKAFSGFTEIMEKNSEKK